MNPALIFNALASRIQADTGTGGLYAGGSYAAGGIITDVSAVQASPAAIAAGTTIFPYLVLTVGMKANPAFANCGANFLLTVEAYEARSAGISANLMKIANRLFGDAMLQAGRIPTYGFDLHPLVLSTNAALNPLACIGHPMQWEDGDTFSDTPDFLKMTLTYSGGISAPAVTP